MESTPPAQPVIEQPVIDASHSSNQQTIESTNPAQPVKDASHSSNQQTIERKECEISHGEVFYSCVHDSCKEVASKIFKWLGLHPIPKLISPGTQNVATILILQCDRGRASDDISSVRNEYIHYHDKTIIILSLLIHDAKDHTKRYCIENMPPDRNITFLEIHQRANGDIHECKGNQFCRKTVQEILGIAKQKDDQIHLQNPDVECAVLKDLLQFKKRLMRSLSVKEFDNASSDLKNPSSVNMKCTEDSGSVAKFFKSLRHSIIGSSSEPNFDHDTKEFIQKTEEYIKCFEKWKDNHYTKLIELSGNVNPVRQEQDEEKELMPGRSK